MPDIKALDMHSNHDKKRTDEWLEQISRIHEEERQQRFADSEAEIQRILKSREEE